MVSLRWICNVLLFVLVADATNYIVQTDPSKTLDFYKIKYQTHFEALQATDSFPQTFNFGNITGFQGEFSREFLQSLYDEPSVLEISADKFLKLDDVQEFAPRHLARLSQRNPLKDNQALDYVFDPTLGIGIDVMVIDSGINKAHPEFTGRVKQLANFVGEFDVDDVIGHGSAIAGVIGSETYGVAKKCNLVDIKVTNRERVTKSSDVIRALKLVTEEAKTTERPTVVVLAMSAKKDKLLNSIIENIIEQGIPVITSAGNEGGLGCNYSPGSATGVLTVGSIDDSNDKIAKFSNWGACVDIFAPGVSVLTTGNVDDYVTKASGTSISAGIVAGLTAYYMGMGQTGLEAVYTIKQIATPNTIHGLFLKPYTVNKIAYNCDGHPTW